MKRQRWACTRYPSAVLALVLVLFLGSCSQSSRGKSAQPTATFKRISNMLRPHSAHQAFLLANGKVLIFDSVFIRASKVAHGEGEMYDPEMRRFEEIPDITIEKSAKRGLTFGGLSIADSSVAGSYLFSLIGAKALGERSFYRGVLLPDQRVLITGGAFPEPGRRGAFLDTDDISIYDPRNGSLTTVGHLKQARNSHTASLLPNGDVLVCGGQHYGYLKSVELISTKTFKVTRLPDMHFPHTMHCAVVLRSGDVLVLGGKNDFADRSGNTSIAKAELYLTKKRTFVPVGEMAERRCVQACTLLPNGDVLITGGSNSPDTYEEFVPLQSAEICTVRYPNH